MPLDPAPLERAELQLELSLTRMRHRLALDSETVLVVVGLIYVVRRMDICGLEGDCSWSAMSQFSHDLPHFFGTSDYTVSPALPS